MERRDVLYIAGMALVSGLLIANLLKPGTPYAADSSRDAQPVAISAAGESAWAIVGNKVYYMTMRNRSDLPSGQRSINVIDGRPVE